MEDSTVVGICGKPCCGKSFFIDSLKGDYEIIDCDKLAKEIFEENKDVIHAMLGTSSKEEVARLIFHGSESSYRKYMFYIWGKVRTEVIERIHRSKAKTIIIDAPLLKESGLNAFCDTVISFETNFNLRLKRAKLRGWSVDELKARDEFFTGRPLS